MQNSSKTERTTPRKDKRNSSPRRFGLIRIDKVNRYARIPSETEAKWEILAYTIYLFICKDGACGDSMELGATDLMETDDVLLDSVGNPEIRKRLGELLHGDRGLPAAGNGSIMRLAPVPMFFHGDRDAAIRISAESSRTTHGADECIDACRLLAAILFDALSGKPKEEVLAQEDLAFNAGKPLTPRIQAIAEGQYRKKAESQIKGTGYVVDCLEAALWCFDRSDNYRDAILMAVNLGDDADTTAAVCGQVGGAYYGESGIPPEWLERLAMRETISGLAERLLSVGPSMVPQNSCRR